MTPLEDAQLESIKAVTEETKARTELMRIEAEERKERLKFLIDTETTQKLV